MERSATAKRGWLFAIVATAACSVAVVTMFSGGEKVGSRSFQHATNVA